jgi:hypothetical protein
MGVRGIGVVAVAGMALVAAGAVGAQPRITRSVLFSELPNGWIAGIPRDVRAESRIVGVVGGRRLAVAPTRNRNFCEAFAASFAGCRVRRAGVINPTLIGGPSRTVAAIGGDVVAQPGILYVKFGAAPARPVPVRWVSRPIAAGFFFATAPSGQKTIRLILKRGSRTVSRTELLRIPARR